MKAIEVRKGSQMFRPTIVIWLVVLVLTLNVVAFTTRIIEKCRLANRASQNPRENDFCHADRSTGTLSGIFPSTPESRH
jgi:hypothetical protein